MEVLLQILGGGFYLLNKVFLWLSERHTRSQAKARARQWRIASWVVYLAGLPPWVIIFVYRHNWIAAGVEASGVPAMVLGLVTSFRGHAKNPPRWLDWLALVCIPLGFGYSVYDFGGITHFGQWLEIGLVIGFLLGTYLLAKNKPSGYAWFVLMHLCCGWLMLIEHYPWLFAQQLVSLIFIGDAYRIALSKQHT